MTGGECEDWEFEDSLPESYMCGGGCGCDGWGFWTCRIGEVVRIGEVWRSVRPWDCGGGGGGGKCGVGEAFTLEKEGWDAWARRGVSVSGTDVGCAEKDEDACAADVAFADRRGNLIFFSSSIESSSSACIATFGCNGNSRLDSSFGKRSLGSSALLIGIFSTASANRLYSISG